MSPEEITAALGEVVEEVTGIPADRVTADPSARFVDDLEIDSLTMVEVVVAAEQRFDVRIPDADIDQLVTVNDVVDYVQRRQSAGAATGA